MKKITEYFRLIIFVVAMLVGIQAPSFVDQYGKSLESHLRESNLSMQEFQKDADEYFNGDMVQLIGHYLSIKDRVVNSGGENIEDLYLRNMLLKSVSKEFKLNSYRPYIVIFKNMIPDILDEVRENYTFSIILDKIAILLGAIFGFLALFFLTLVNFIGRLFKKKN